MNSWVRVEPAAVVSDPGYHWLGAIFAFLILSSLGVIRASAQEGGIPGSNGLVPQLTIDDLVAGETATLTVGQLAPATDGRPVLLAFSPVYAGIDASAILGPGAVIVPAVTFDPEANPAVFPSRAIPGGSPRRVLTARVPQFSGGRRLFVQVFVDDPEAPGGGGWALSDGFEVTVERPEGIVAVQINPTPAQGEVGKNIAFEAAMFDGFGQMVPATTVDDIDFSVVSGSGSLFFSFLNEGRVGILYRTPAAPEIGILRATETISGNARSADTIVRTLAGEPSGAFVLTATPSSLPADEASTATVTGGPIRDRFGNQVEDGELITVSASEGSIHGQDLDLGMPGFQTATLGGAIAVVVRSAAQPGSASIVADSVRGDAQGSTTIEFTGVDPLVSSVVLLPESTTLEVNGTVVLTAELRDSLGAFVPAASSNDVLFGLATGGGTFFGTTLVGGRVQITYRAATTPQSATIVVTEAVSGQSFQDSAAVISVPGPPAGTIFVTANDLSIPADGVSTTAIQGGPVRDGFGNLIPNGTLVTVLATAGSLIGSDVDSTRAGLQRATTSGFFGLTLRSSSIPQNAFINASSVTGSASGSAAVEFTELEPEIASVDSSPASVEREAGSAVVVTAELRDEFGVFISASSASDIGFILTSGTGTLSNRQLITGRVSITYIASTTVETARIVSTETVSGSQFNDDTVVLGRPGSPDGPFLLSCSPTMLVADGASVSTVTSGLITDAFGNPVSIGELVTVSVSSGSVLASDVATEVPGIQVSVNGGTISFDIRSSTTPGTGDVTAVCVSGSASGSCEIVYTEPPASGSATIAWAGTLPTPRSQMATLSDNLEGKAYLLGGLGKALPLDVIEVDFSRPFGSQLRILEDVLPESRYSAPAVWDPVRRVGYVFGGLKNPIFNHFTVLVYDPGAASGEKFATLPNDPLPLSIVDGSAVWSPSEQVAYVFEGTLGVLRVLRFDPSAPEGQRLTLLSDVLSGVYTRTSAVWDDNQAVAYVFGGSTAGGPIDDIRRFDPSAPAGSRITLLADSLPSPRTNLSSVWDPVRRVAYLCGGSSAGGPLTEVLEFDPGLPSGSRVSLAGTLADPVTRSSVHYDPDLRTIYLLGGFSAELQDHTDRVVSFDPTTGVSCLTNRLENETAYSSAVYSPPTGESFVFGGRHQGGFYDTIYRVDPLDGAGCQLQLLPADRLPSARYSTAAVWGSGVAYIFGGLTSLSEGTDEIVVFDPSAPAGGRVSVFPESLPRPVFHSSVVWDDGAQVAYLFDSSTSVAPVSVIRFDPSAPMGQRVTQLSPDSISGRLHASAVWDPERDVAYLFGGSNGVQTLNEIVEFDPTRPAGQRFANLADSLLAGRSATAAVWNDALGVVYLFDGLSEVLEFDPSAATGFRVTILGNTQLPLAFSSAVYDTVQQRAYAFGGFHREIGYRADVTVLVQD